MRLRVRSKLILYISIPLVITYAAMLGWDYVQQRSDASDVSEGLVLGKAQLAAAILDARLGQAQQIAASLAESFSQAQPVADLRTRWIPRAAVTQFDWAVGIVVAFEDRARPGMVVQRPREQGAADLPPGMDYRSPKTPWYWEVKQTRRGDWFAPSDVAGVFARPTIAYSAPIVSDGQFRGVVVLHISPDVFQLAPGLRPARYARAATRASTRSTSRPTSAPAGEVTTQTANFTQDSYLITNGPGEVVFHFPDTTPAPANLSDPVNWPVVTLLGDALQAARNDKPDLVTLRDAPVKFFDVNRGGNYWVATVPIRGGRWIMLSTYPEARYMDPINASMIRRSIFLFGGLCFLLAIVAFASHRIIRPLEALEHSTQALGAGNLDVAVQELRGGDEVAELSRMFNAMLQRLRAQVQQIREESEARARVEGEMEMARQIQTSLLPREMLRGKADAPFALHACNLPASQVAGDYYDFFVGEDGRVMLVIADVSGHGMPAALLMAVTRTLIRNHAADGMSPAEIAVHTNASLLDNGTLGMFVTLVICVYDPKTGEVAYTNAGHPEPLVLRRDGEVERTTGSTAPLLGAYEFGPQECTQSTIRLQEGDMLVLYTDGIPEARPRVDAEEFGHERFFSVLQAEANRPLDEICSGVIETVQDYQQGRLEDDVTMLLVRRG
jgi:phosphoserine phosphatase RsbU/P